MTKEQIDVFQNQKRFKVEIVNGDENIRTKKGQIYLAMRYWLDPNSKVSLITRLTKKDHKPIGLPPQCNEYLHNIKIIVE